ncbi:MAG: cell division protein FtsZ [Oscillospiraceae bacterium]|nr:cell division protein FtsZ [Oscillospiraceae bacterium]
MSNNFDMDFEESIITLKIVGVGGGGGNAINRMVGNLGNEDKNKDLDLDNETEEDTNCIEYLAINTDRQALKRSKASYKIAIGEKLTKGRGAGGNPEQGRKAAEESREEIGVALRGAQMAFITAGMGGGTGTGAAPIVAEVAKDQGILTVGIVTKPFEFEGKDRMEQAEKGIIELKQHVDSLLVIPNDRLSLLPDANITLANAFKSADDILRQATLCISKIVTDTGLINLDFADLAAVMQDAGEAHMGVGKGTGKDKARQAVEMAISSPLLETSIDGAKALIVNFVASPDIGLNETALANSMIKEAAHNEAKIFWGVTFDETMKDEVEITVIATKFDNVGDNLSKKNDAESSMQNGVASNSKDDTDKVLTDDDDFFVHLTSKLNSFDTYNNK